MSRPRVYPPMKVGDRFGDREVIELLPRGHGGRRDQVVRWRCICGRTGVICEFNLRGQENTCARHGLPGPRSPVDRVRLVASGRRVRLSKNDRAAMRKVLSDYDRLLALAIDWAIGKDISGGVA